MYYAFLRRGGELSGFNFWVSQLDNHLETREQVRKNEYYKDGVLNKDGFFYSTEFQSRVQQIISQGCLR